MVTLPLHEIARRLNISIADVKHKCPHCVGTGANLLLTMRLRELRKVDSEAYVRCWHCCGSGTDNAAYFNWSKPNDVEDI